MRILLTNDDGINSDGIYALYKELCKIAEVHIVAPDVERSAVGHAITLSDPLRVTRIYKDKRFFGYAVSGTPADCVKIAVMKLLKKRPDMVFSGINLGPNVGISVLYSGTVCGATEGAILGIPSVAVSLAKYKNADFSYAAQFAKGLALKVKKNWLRKNPLLLNVNVPGISKGMIKGVRVARQGIDGFVESYEKRIDPRERLYYWLTGDKIKIKGNANCDVTALRKGYITITPIQYDMTNYTVMKELASWKIKR